VKRESVDEVVAVRQRGQLTGQRRSGRRATLRIARQGRSTKTDGQRAIELERLA
jgi:hypothetical protein